MKVGLTKNQCNQFKEIIDKKNKEIEILHNYIDGMTAYFKQSQDIGQKIHNLILPLIKPIQPMTLDKYIDLSTIKGHNKKYLKSLFKKYLDYCKENINISDYKVIDNCPLDLNLDIYNPDNVLKFMSEKCNFGRTSVKKIRDIFLLAMRKCTRNPYLDYSVPLSKTEPPNLKHYIKFEELEKFMKYLKENKDFELSLIFELLYKFGIRVGAISKLKVDDILDDRTIIFNEKNNKTIKRKLKEKLFEKLKKLIKINERKKSDYIFYPNLKPNNIEERAKLFSIKLSKIIKESNCFDKKKNETISAHMFRATHAINIFSKYGLQMAAKELNHSRDSTTSQHYIKIEDRGLLNEEEERLFDQELDQILFGIEDDKKKISHKFTEIVEITNNDKGKRNKIKNTKDKIGQINSDFEYEDDSLYDQVFDFELNNKKIKNNININLNVLNKKRKRFLEENNLYDNIEDKNYENFINDNEIKFSLIIIPEIKINKNNLQKANLLVFKKYLDKKGLLPAKNIKSDTRKINLITRAYSIENIHFFNNEILSKINQHLNNLNDFNYDLFKLKIEKDEIEIYSNRDIDEGTFIIDIYGTYTYRKKIEYENKDPNGFNDIMLFKCRDKNYDRFLKSSIFVNLGSILARPKKNSSSNCKIIKYVDYNLEVKAAIASTKLIKKGEKLELKSQ